MRIFHRAVRGLAYAWLVLVTCILLLIALCAGNAIAGFLFNQSPVLAAAVVGVFLLATAVVLVKWAIKP